MSAINLFTCGMRLNILCTLFLTKENVFHKKDHLAVQKNHPFHQKLSLYKRLKNIQCVFFYVIFIKTLKGQYSDIWQRLMFKHVMLLHNRKMCFKDV